MKAGCLSVKMMISGKEPVHIFHQQICSIMKIDLWQVTGKHFGATHEHDNIYNLQQDACAVLMHPKSCRSGLVSRTLYVWLGRTKPVS